MAFRAIYYLATFPGCGHKLFSDQGEAQEWCDRQFIHRNPGQPVPRWVVNHDQGWEAHHGRETRGVVNVLKLDERPDSLGHWDRDDDDVMPEPVADAYSPALPWAARLDADDLEGFLADLADAASGTEDLDTLAEVESAIARWTPTTDRPSARPPRLGGRAHRRSSNR